MLSQVGIGAEPKNGGSAKFGLVQSATTDTMDLGILNTGTQAPVLGAMSNSLMEVDSKGNIVGASSCSRAPTDGCSWRRNAVDSRGQGYGQAAININTKRRYLVLTSPTREHSVITTCQTTESWLRHAQSRGRRMSDSDPCDLIRPKTDGNRQR
jgi:hypothetical protein